MATHRLFLFSLIICAFSAPTYGFFEQSKEAERQAYNDQNLAALKKFLNVSPETALALVSDLHEVLFDRLPGDFERAKQVGALQMCTFLGHLMPFGCKYLAYKMGLTNHPSLEYHIVDVGEKEPNKELMQLISPFTINPDMASLYKNCKYPIFACSNIGQQSYDYLDKKFACDKLFMGKQIATAENGYLQKDRPETYQALYATMTSKMGKAPAAILMLDDRKENLIACQKALTKELPSTVYGFIFKNHADLAAALQKHGLDTLLKVIP